MTVHNYHIISIVKFSEITYEFEIIKTAYNAIFAHKPKLHTQNNANLAIEVRPYRCSDMSALISTVRNQRSVNGTISVLSVEGHDYMAYKSVFSHV